jgi:uncharacterized membrane protein
MSDQELIALRLIHITFGVFWAGSAIFFAVILQPRLETLEPAVRGQVMGALIPVMGPVLLGSAAITIVAGLTLALRMHWGNLDIYIDTAWGRAISVGLVAAIGAISSGIITVINANRMITLGRAVATGSASPEEAGQMQRIGARLPRLARGTAVMVLVAIGAMASAEAL